ncbi:NAD(P)/FAD-dependent oxidoreductase [Bacillus sp. EB600]|uniref:NAD(P)/FAD-dependent oxidoreductase n=1 Tax=Bacillus sp. EB600 TaxID=2806345 RepID=UPI00210D6337|nr:NAD(P)/FAD-dependent oxidoreductase [Bacillus sp. EB600]MCQ6280361.1 NAD(P)/FAD-dependent oxidoreductase [Bacillus sp. EB600]
MKIAIMGAGLSGLACAIVLERNGHSPIIFEKRSQPGDRFINAEIIVSILTSPINDAYRFFSEEYQLFLKPISQISKLIVHSENTETAVKEQLGFINVRGRHQHSFEQQLADQVATEIIYHSEYTYEDLLQEFTHVVVATGDAQDAVNLNNFHVDRAVTLKGATVEGEFEPSTIHLWLNNKIAPKGYAYILPFSPTEANIVTAFPQSSFENENDTELWSDFYKIVCSKLKQPLKISDEFHVKNYLIGSCKYPRIGNTFFTGNCFGALMPFLGFGQFTSLLTGIYAAYDLCGLGKYEELTKPLTKKYRNSLVFREIFEKLDNSVLDTIVGHMGGFVGGRFLKAGHFPSLRALSYVLRPFVK